jgi:glycosyltransferase involved in cell wall biosynthesis/SAM-dependent methyltransferase
MKIVFLAFDKPDYAGGPIVNIRRLVPALCAAGHDVSVLAFFNGGDAPNIDVLRKQGFHCQLLAWEPWDTRRHVRWILKQLARLGPDVFVPNVMVSGYYAARWAREVGVSTIGTMRSGDSFHQALADTFVKGADTWRLSGMVCVSEELERYVQNGAPLDFPTCVIPSGVPVPETVAMQDGPLRLVHAGRLVQEQKRIRETVSALERVLAADATMTAGLIGAGPEERWLTAFLENSVVGTRCRHLGHVDVESIQRTLAEFNVFVLLSDYEGTPGSLMDAMATGLVPVCLDIPGGVRELVIHDETGLLVADRDGAFDVAIHRLAGDLRLRRRLAENARRRVREAYSLPVAVARWDAFLKQVSGASQGVPRPIRAPVTIGDLPVADPLLREVRLLSKSIDDEARRVKSLEAYTAPRCSVETLDTYTVRAAILRRLKEASPQFKGTVLDVGCGYQPYRELVLSFGQVTEYLGLELEKSVYPTLPDLTWDGRTIPLDADRVDGALATEVFEHCVETEAILREILRVLRPGGLLFFSVPFLWPLHNVPHDQYRFTPYSFKRHLECAGFEDLSLGALGGWDAALAQMIGLWVRRRRMSNFARRVLSVPAAAVVHALVRRDWCPNVWADNVMISGLYGTARKPPCRSGESRM